MKTTEDEWSQMKTIEEKRREMKINEEGWKHDIAKEQRNIDVFTDMHLMSEHRRKESRRNGLMEECRRKESRKRGLMKKSRRNGLMKESRRNGLMKECSGNGLIKDSRRNDYIVQKFPTKNLWITDVYTKFIYLISDHFMLKLVTNKS